MDKNTENILNCAGLDCPQPVIKTKNFIEAKESIKELRVIVDNEPAVENVTRMLKSMAFEVKASKHHDLWHLDAKRDAGYFIKKEEKEESHSSGTKTAVLILSEYMGRGDNILGEKLMINYIATLKEMGSDLWRIVLLNGGVKLACEGHEALKGLKDLEKEGVSILVCGTCLEHFKILKDKKVGDTTNMLDVVTSLQLADKVIRI